MFHTRVQSKTLILYSGVTLKAQARPAYPIKVEMKGPVIFKLAIAVPRQDAQSTTTNTTVDRVLRSSKSRTNTTSQVYRNAGGLYPIPSVRHDNSAVSEDFAIVKFMSGPEAIHFGAPTPDSQKKSMSTIDLKKAMQPAIGLTLKRIHPKRDANDADDEEGDEANVEVDERNIDIKDNDNFAGLWIVKPDEQGQLVPSSYYGMGSLIRGEDLNKFFATGGRDFATVILVIKEAVWDAVGIAGETIQFRDDPLKKTRVFKDDVVLQVLASSEKKDIRIQVADESVTQYAAENTNLKERVKTDPESIGRREAEHREECIRWSKAYFIVEGNYNAASTEIEQLKKKVASLESTINTIDRFLGRRVKRASRTDEETTKTERTIVRRQFSQKRARPTGQEADDAERSVKKPRLLAPADDPRQSTRSTEGDEENGEDQEVEEDEEVDEVDEDEEDDEDDEDEEDEEASEDSDTSVLVEEDAGVVVESENEDEDSDSPESDTIEVQTPGKKSVAQTAESENSGSDGESEQDSSDEAED